jgi:oligosaccharide repeat unit polymerase
LFSFAFLSLIWTGGIRNNIFHIFIIAVQFLYFFNTPQHYYGIESWKAFNVDVRDYFEVGFAQIGIHLFCYLLGYATLSRKINNKYPEQLTEIIPEYSNFVSKKVVSVFVILFAIIFLNTLYTGINLIDVVMGKFDRPTLGLKGGTYFLQNFADSLITLLIAAYYFKVKKSSFFWMILVAFALFLILGFRYRLLLSIFGFGMVYMLKNRIRLIAFVKYAMVGFVAFYFVIFISFNRYALATQNYEEIAYDLTEFNYENVYNETFGSMVDFALYKAHDDELINIDYGQTMIGIIFVRIIPASFFPNGQKPYPPPQLISIDKALDVPRENGAASTAIGALFLAFYYPGIYIGGFCLGLIVGASQRMINGMDVFKPLFGIAIMLALFQWLTRGYLPQTIDHLVYLVFPIFILSRFGKNMSSNRIIQS